eukprot:3819134-Prymnesium_polylepis.1
MFIEPSLTTWAHTASRGVPQCHSVSHVGTHGVTWRPAASLGVTRGHTRRHVASTGVTSHGNTTVSHGGAWCHVRCSRHSEAVTCPPPRCAWRRQCHPTCEAFTHSVSHMGWGGKGHVGWVTSG